MLRPDQIPILIETLRFEQLDEDMGVLLGGEDHHIVRGAPAVAAVASIDGERSLGELLALARGAHCEVSMLMAIDDLVALGLCRAADAPSTQEISVPPVRIVSHVGGDLAMAMAATFERAGIPQEDGAELELVLTSEYLESEVVRNERLSSARERLLVNPVGRRPLFGPLLANSNALGPDARPCAVCLEYWLAHNQPVQAWVRNQRGQALGAPATVSASGSSVQLALAGAAHLVAQLYRDPDFRAQLRSHVLELDLVSGLATRMHRLVRRPQCRACGDHSRMRATGSRPIELTPVPIAFADNGGFRVSTPEQTYRRLEHHISGVIGAVTHVDAVERPEGRHRWVFRSSHRMTPSEVGPHIAFEYQCGGKGRTRAQARASALCEALERYSSVYQGDEALELATATELGPRAILPSQLQGFSDAQTLRGTSQPADVAAHHWCAHRACDQQILRWTPAFDLRGTGQRFVPFTYCYSNTPQWPDLAACRHNPNGTAAGNCPEEAVLQGLLELIERDAVAIWWYNELCRPALDLERFGDAYTVELRREYAEMGWKTWVLDLTHDLGIPVCAALGHNPDRDVYSIGFGCHLEAGLAAQRALTELNQLQANDHKGRAPWDLEALRTRAFLHPGEAHGGKARSWPDIQGIGDLAQAIALVDGRLQDAGLETFVVNKTRPDIDLSVVQMIVPGLRHFWPRFGPGRLFEVPVRMGWQPEARTEGQLNPVSLFV